MKKYYGLRGTRLSVAIVAIAGLDFLLFGYDQGVMGGLLTLPSFRTQFPTIDPTRPGLSASAQTSVATKQGITVASYTLGCFFGAIATIWLGNILGRRRTIFVGSAIMVVGAILQCSAFEIGQLIAGRIITGIGNGMNTSTVPVWQSETSKSHNRGKMVMLEGALITFGVMLSYWVDFGFSFVQDSSLAWRFPIALQIVFALFILAFITRLPESPRWLILKNRNDDALEVLCALNDMSPESEDIKSELAGIRAANAEMSQGSFRDLFTMNEDRHFHRTVLAYVNQMFQQISGINLITYYAATIFEQDIGLSPFLARLLAACNGTEYFLSSWIAFFTIEKVGRRKLMIFGAAGQSIIMACLAVSTSFKHNVSAGIAATVFLFAFNTVFAIGWLGMTWLYPAEIVPLRIRAPANAVSTSANWLWNFVIVMIIPVAFSSIGYQTYIIFAVINAAIVPSVYFFYPETAYRSLEEVDSIFRRTHSIFGTVKAAQTEPHRYDKKGNLLIAYEDATTGESRDGADDDMKGANLVERKSS